MKRLIVSCVAALLLGLLWNYLFNYHISHSLLFWERCAQASDKWAEELRQDNSPCYIFVGGSETRTSIDPQQLLQEHGIRAINAAGQAGYSTLGNFEAATKYFRKGDTIIISYQVANIDIPPSKAGIQYLWKRLGRKMFTDHLIEPNYTNIRDLVIGDGGIYSFTFVKALFVNGPVYSYDLASTIHRSGWMEVLRSHTFSPKKDYPSDKRIYPNGLKDEHYKNLRDQCAKRGVNLIFRTHLSHCPQGYRAANALAILHLVRSGFTVLREDRLGCEPDSGHFSDTVNHLSTEGARIYNHEIGRALRNQSFWTEKELIEKLHTLGRDENGNPI